VKKTTARLIITEDCPRNCDLCCNKQHKATIDAARHVSYDLEGLEKYDAVVITGGEPCLYPDLLTMVVERLKHQLMVREVYLYTSIFSSVLKEHLGVDLDGVTYSLHYPITNGDVGMFRHMGHLVADRQSASCRLWVDQRITWDNPFVAGEGWKRVTIAPMLRDCPTLHHEELYVLEGGHR